MKISTTKAIKMTTLLAPEDGQVLNQSLAILHAISGTLVNENCDTIALQCGEELHNDDLQNAIETLQNVLYNLPEETEIWGC